MGSNYNCENSTSNGIGFDVPPVSVIKDKIQIPTGIVITIANLLTFVALYRCSRLSYQIRILAINLCLSDAVTGSSLIVPHRFYFYNNCGFKKYPTSFFVVVSALTVTMINLDRCLAIHYGIRYYIYMSRKILISICMAFWLLSVPIVYLLYFDEDAPLGISCKPIFYVSKNSVTIIGSCILLAMAISNLVMFSFLVHAVRMSVSRSPHTKQTGYPEQAKVIRKLVVITGCFMVCSLPYIILTFPILDNNNPRLANVHKVMGVFFVANSFMNPLLYVWRLREARYQVKRLLGFWNRGYISRLEKQNKEDTATYSIYAKPLPLYSQKPS